MTGSGLQGARVHLYPPVWRSIAAGLVGISRVSLPLLLVAGLLAGQPISLFVWVRALAVFALLPAFAAWLIARAFTGRLEIRAGVLVAYRHDLQLEIPGRSIEHVAPWRLPLPGPGFSLRMRSGRRLPDSFEVGDPTPILSTLADAARVENARAAVRHPTVLYAHAKHSVGRWRWYHALAKFVLFTLLPTAVWFNAHQHIAYGGLLGQYYLEGLGAYLKTFGVSWGLASIYLLLYASAWRALAEGVALLTAWVAPAHAVAVRWTAELACRVFYYVGVPVIVLVPFLL